MGFCVNLFKVILKLTSASFCSDDVLILLITRSERQTPFFLAALSIISEASFVLFFVRSHLTDSGINLKMQGNY
jgi:hypothetical protein